MGRLDLSALLPQPPAAPQPPAGRGGGPAYGQTPFGGYEAQPGLSPTEARSLEIDIDKGVAQRLRTSISVAPSVRQQTQGEVINLQLLYERLGNPFSIRRIPFSVLRDMATDPMINFALYFTKVPLIRATWDIDCQDAQIAAAVDEALRAVNSATQVQILGKLSYGFQPMCKRFKLGQLRNFYRDPYSDDPEKDLPVWDSSLDAILWDRPQVLAPEHCMPKWNERGEFDGFYYSTVPLPNPVQTGVSSLYGYSVVPGYTIGPEFAMWPVNERDDNFGSIFGSPRTKRAYRYYWSYWYRWAIADRAFESVGDPLKYVYFPTDVDQAIDSDDPNINGNPAVEHMRQRALALGAQMRNGAVIAMPGDFVVDEQGRQTTHRKWEAGYIESKANFGELAASFSYLDSMKFRCLTADTPIDCPRDHRRFPDGVPISMLEEGDPVWTFNLIDQKFELRKVQKSMMTQRSQPVFRIKLSNGKDIRATGNHPFLTTGLEWRETSELSPGDRLVAFVRDFEPHIKLDPTSYGGCRVKEYHAVAEWMGIRGTEENLHVHHRDAFHANTDVENLQGLAAGEHHSLERTGRRVSAATREKQSQVKLKITDDVRAAKLSELQKADDLMLERYKNQVRICSSEGCDSEAKCRGLCLRCYQRIRYRKEDLPPTIGFSDRSYGTSICECGREFVIRGNQQYQCQACRYQFLIDQNRTWRERKEREGGGGVVSGPPPTFEECCDSVVVLSVDLDSIEDVWDVSVEGTHNFVSNGVVLHNSMLIPESAFIEGTRGATGGTGSAGSSRMMGVQLGEVYQQSQQLLADENDGDINRDMIPQFIAANFPDKAGIPCRKVTRGFGAYDTELMKQVIQLVGQVKGEVLPVDIRELLRQAGIPLMSDKQQKIMERQIAEEAVAEQPTPRPPQKVGMQGYNAGIKRTDNGVVYVQPPERIDLANLHHGVLGDLPDIPAYKDASVKSAMLRLRKSMLDRYKSQIESFIIYIGSQTSLHLAQQAAPQDVQTQDVSQPGVQPPAAPQQQPKGLSQAQAAGVAAAVIGAWLVLRDGDDGVRDPISAALFSIAQRAAKRELKMANLGADALDLSVILERSNRRATQVMDSIDSTIQGELQTFLTSELQRTTTPEQISESARKRFEDTPQSHADRVVLSEALPAYNHGALTALRDAGVVQVQAHDASNGRDQTTDPDCKRRNGKVMTVEGAIQEAEDVHPHDTLWFSPLSTDNFMVEYVEKIPKHLNGQPDMQAAYDRDSEVLYITEGTEEEERESYAVAVGTMLTLR